MPPPGTVVSCRSFAATARPASYRWRRHVLANRPGSAPDLVAPYAMAPEKVRGNSVEVEGGAFRSRQNWFNIRFRCEVDADGQAVVAFALAIGDAIPRDEWQEHDLVADDGEADQ